MVLLCAYLVCLLVHVAGLGRERKLLLAQDGNIYLLKLDDNIDWRSENKSYFI